MIANASAVLTFERLPRLVKDTFSRSSDTRRGRPSGYVAKIRSRGAECMTPPSVSGVDQRTNRKAGRCRGSDARFRGLVASVPALLSSDEYPHRHLWWAARSRRPNFAANALLHEAMILLHDVVEILHGPVPTAARQVARAPQPAIALRWVGQDRC